MGWFDGGNKDKDKDKDKDKAKEKSGFTSFKDMFDGGGKGGSGASYSNLSNKDYVASGGKARTAGTSVSGWTDKSGTKKGIAGVAANPAMRAALAVASGGLSAPVMGLANLMADKGNPANIDGVSNKSLDKLDASRPKSRPSDLGVEKQTAIADLWGSNDKDRDSGITTVAKKTAPVLDKGDKEAQTEMPAGGRIPNPAWVIGMPEDQRYLSNPSYAQIIAYRKSLGTQTMAEGGIASIEEEDMIEGDGGLSSIPQRNDKEVIVDAIKAIRGEIEDPRSAIMAFVEKYGEDKMSDLYDRVQSGEMDSVVSREDGVLKGPGDGLDDMIPANIDGKEDLRLADNEHVISADVVAALGNGSSDAGHKRLKEMTDRIRKAAHGTTKQQNEVDAKEVLPV